MRAIKFRAQRVDNGEFAYGNFVDMSEIVSNWFYIEFAQDGQRFRHLVNPETVGQFTGLHDNKGKEVFEGDIIKKCGYNKKERQWIKYYCVIYEYDAFCLEKDGETYAFGFSKDGKLIKEEIIGNIHEHNFLLDEN